VVLVVVVLVLFVCFGGTGERTLCLVLAKQALYYFSHTPQSFLLWFVSQLGF
jgi:hypothetical protein